MCGSIVDMQYLTADNSQEKNRKKKKVTTAAKHIGLPMIVRGHNKKLAIKKYFTI